MLLDLLTWLPLFGAVISKPIDLLIGWHNPTLVAKTGSTISIPLCWLRFGRFVNTLFNRSKEISDETIDMISQKLTVLWWYRFTIINLYVFVFGVIAWFCAILYYKFLEDAPVGAFTSPVKVWWFALHNLGMTLNLSNIYDEGLDNGLGVNPDPNAKILWWWIKAITNLGTTGCHLFPVFLITWNFDARYKSVKAKLVDTAVLKRLDLKDLEEFKLGALKKKMKIDLQEFGGAEVRKDFNEKAYELISMADAIDAKRISTIRAEIESERDSINRKQYYVDQAFDVLERGDVQELWKFQQRIRELD
jgi:hypothetical protein